MIMYPPGHARNTSHDLDDHLANKWKALAAIASEDPDALVARFNNLETKSCDDIQSINNFDIADREPIE